MNSNADLSKLVSASSPNGPKAILPPPRDFDLLRSVLDEVALERFRQDYLVVTGQHPFNLANEVPHTKNLPVLIEEVGEVGKALYELEHEPFYPKRSDEQRLAALRTERIHVAACAVAWLESIPAPTNTNP